MPKEDAKEKTPVVVEVVEHSEWKAATIDLHSTKQSGVVHVPAKKSWFHCEILPFENALPVTAFVTKSGNAWIGPEGAGTNFYIETDSGVLRGFHNGFNNLVWCESLVTMPRDPRISIDQIIAQFGRKPDANALFDAAMFCRKETGKIQKTNLSEPLDWFHRLHIPYSPITLVGAGIVGIQVTRDTLRLDLENKDHELDYAVSVWIDINSKKVVKAVEKGKQVFPK